jgi:hypothetical protein
MKRISVTGILLLVIVAVSAQKKMYAISADSVLVTSDCGSAELIIENNTSNVDGYLHNKEKGRTEFSRLRLVAVGDSAIAIAGQDTLLLRDIWWLSSMARGLTIAPDTNYVIPVNAKVVLLPEITTPRFISLPPPASSLNREIVIIDKTVGASRWKINGAFVNRGNNSAPPYTAENNVTMGKGDKLVLICDGVKWYNTLACCTY